jgi:hypothetical protein
MTWISVLVFAFNNLPGTAAIEASMIIDCCLCIAWKHMIRFCSVVWKHIWFMLYAIFFLLTVGVRATLCTPWLEMIYAICYMGCSLRYSLITLFPASPTPSCNVALYIGRWYVFGALETW